jgi:choline-sulfatase
MKKISPESRPNILILITDQQRAVMHFPKDWSEKHLPSLTLLKNNGVEFVQGFCNSCMCTPSRSTLFTSLYPAQHGCTDTLSFGGKYSITEPTLDPTLPNLAKMLRPYYDVHYRGKWHLSKGGMNNVHPEKSLMRAEVAQFGFDGWVAPDAGEDIALPNFGAGYAAHDALYIQQAVEFVRQYKADKAAGKPRKPFALVVSLVNPHDVLAFPKTYEDGGYDETWTLGDIQLPLTVDEKLMDNWKPAAQWQLKAVMALSLGELKKPSAPGDPNLQLQYINFYGNLMAYIDQQMAQLLEEFYDRDKNGKFGAAKQLAKDTLILRLSDHGEMGMAHGGLRQKAFNAYEETLRVPYIFSNPAFINSTGKAKVSNQLASLIDIVPTLAGVTGIDTSDMGFKGRDLSAAVLNPDLKEPIQHSILFTFDDVKSGNKNTGQTVFAADRLRCVRTDEWKYVKYFDANGAYLQEYELYYIKGVTEFETHPGDDPNDPLGMALKGQPYEYVNLYYGENPLVKAMPEAAKAQIEKGKAAMEALLQARMPDIKIGTELKIRKQLGNLPKVEATN